MVVRGHFVDAKWKLQNRVLSFCKIPPPHSGICVADALYKCFTEWGIQNKVCSITLDNATYNDVAMRSLKATFSASQSLILGGNIFHVRCCAHIVNLLVQDGLSEIEAIVDCVRETVRYLLASEGRHVRFNEIKSKFKLSSNELTLDCPTRWNSTYLMLATALEFRDVFSAYKERDEVITVPNNDDWLKVKKVCEFLATFNDFTNIITGSKYPTANLFLLEVWRIKELLEKTTSGDCEYLWVMAEKMKLKFDKYWGECNLLMAIAAVLDPRYRMVFINYSFPLIYSPTDARKNEEIVRGALYELYTEYVAGQSQDQRSRPSGSQSRVPSPNISGVMSGKEMFDSFIRRSVTIQPLKSELEVYSDEQIHVCEKILTLMPWNGGNSILSSSQFYQKWHAIFYQFQLLVWLQKRHSVREVE